MLFRDALHSEDVIMQASRCCRSVQSLSQMRREFSEFIPAATAGCCACFFTNPLEVVKTRMQLQGELQARGSYSVHYRNVFHASYTIAKHEGLTALQKGLCPALLYQVIMNGTRLSSYQIFTNAGLTSGTDGKPVFLKCVVAGGISGGLSAFLSNPTMLLKTQFQSQAAHNIAVGYQHAHTGLSHAVHTIYTQHGIRGLWRGVSAGVPRNAIGTSTQLSTFDVTKDFIKSGHLFRPDSWLIPALASFISSIALVVTMTPLDVVSTRLFNQNVSQSGQGIFYKGIWDCFKKIFYKEGFSGFYKGFGPQYFRSGPQTILSLMFWDKLRKIHFDYIVDYNQCNTES